MIYISAQPDNIYFHWQVELYLYQFSKHGIIDDCYALFGYSGSEPSAYAVELSKKYKGVKLYKDTRSDKSYIPSIRPNILKQFFNDYPELGKAVFYHDSDIFLVKMPKFDLLLNNDIGYVSDTVSYIGYNYIHECAQRYKETYNELRDDDIFYGMTEVIGIDPELVKVNELNSGGAQYLLKNINSNFFEECEKHCSKLYAFFRKYDKQWPIKNPIQSWTTDMWVVLWEYLKRGNAVECHKELDFSWATSTIADYHKKNIFHLAGITSETGNNKFYKGLYTNKNIFVEYLNNKSIFDHIDKNNATYEYTNVIKEYCEYGNIISSKIDYCDVFSITGGRAEEHVEKNIFTRITNKECCQKPIWKSIDDKLIIFWNCSSWIMTLSCHIDEISQDCKGGIYSCSGDLPYTNTWNFPYNYKIKCHINSQTIRIVTTVLLNTTQEQLIVFINNVRNNFLPQYRKKFYILMPENAHNKLSSLDCDVVICYNSQVPSDASGDLEYKLKINRYIPSIVVDSTIPYEYIEYYY